MVTKVVGVTFSNEDGSSRARIIASMSESDQICLERDPYNQFDSNAVKVCVIKNGAKKQIGFLAKDIASEVSPKLRRGVNYKVTIRGCGMWNGRPYCEIEVKEGYASQSSTTDTGNPLVPRPVAQSPVAPKPVIPKSFAPSATTPQTTYSSQKKVSHNQGSHVSSNYSSSRNKSSKSGCIGVIVLIVIAASAFMFL